MKKINKHNYEAFFLDYYEKNLSTEEVAELMLFLENHPNLKEEFEDYEEIILEPDTTVIFENKNSLKKNSLQHRWKHYSRKLRKLYCC